jgi:hypothetical protein
MENIHNILNGKSSGNYSDSFLNVMLERFCIVVDKDWSERQCKLHLFNLFFNGTVYDMLQPWHNEYGEEKYIPLLKRRPCVIYGIPRIIVNDSVSMLFGEGHYPMVRCDDDDDETQDFLQYITRKSNLNAVMLNNARTGSIGSVCTVVKVLNGDFHFDVMSTMNLIPVFDRESPSVLVNVKERNKLRGEVLRAKGFDIPEKELKNYYWVMREWTDTEEIYYKPILVDSTDQTLIRDDVRSTVHNIGFVPIVWMKNSVISNDIDGECTFRPALDMCIEIDYQLSHLARVLHYNADPTMVIKEPSGLRDNELIKGAGALMVGKDGDAKLLEITNSSTKAVIEFVKCLREFSLETLRGNRSNPDKINAINSGKALQMLNSPLVSLVDELRICYGEKGLLKLLQMVLKICSTGLYQINYDGVLPSVEKMTDASSTMLLDWPAWYPPTPMDDFQEAQTLSILTQGAKVLSKESGLASIADKYNILDEDDEIKKIDKENDEIDKKNLTSKKLSVNNE